MAYRGTEPESYITKNTSVYEDRIYKNIQLKRFSRNEVDYTILKILLNENML
jgi:hypothetical protein